MLLYSHAVTLREVPKHISLVLNISQCPFRCTGCHTPELQDSSGVFLSIDLLDQLINENEGITVVTFMGGNQFTQELIDLLLHVKHRGLKTCLYTGSDKVSISILSLLDYIKLGKYKENLGGLESKRTNQRFINIINGKVLNNKFWPKEHLI